MHLLAQDGDLVPEYEQFDVFGAAVAGELGQHLQDLPSNWYASEALMARIVAVKAQRQADYVARKQLEPGLRAAQVHRTSAGTLDTWLAISDGPPSWLRLRRCCAGIGIAGSEISGHVCSNARCRLRWTACPLT